MTVCIERGIEHPCCMNRGFDTTDIKRSSSCRVASAVTVFHIECEVQQKYNRYGGKFWFYLDRREEHYVSNFFMWKVYLSIVISDHVPRSITCFTRMIKINFPTRNRDC